MIRRSTHPPPPPPEPASGTRFGPYTLLDRMAVGGMAEVFRATEPRAVGAPRTLVIKRMLPSLAKDPESVAMFREEARIGSLIHDENVVAHLGAGEHEGHPYLALELVPGLDMWRLSRWLTREGQTLGVGLAIHIARALLKGLQAVHDARDDAGRALNVVHRDVSPSNVFLSIHGDVKLGDLGIAATQTTSSGGQAVQMPGGNAKGKLGYLSPEQVQGFQTEQRSDVFSAAVLTAELLTGKPLFAGGSELAILLAIRDGDIHSFIAAGATLPRGMVDVITCVLSIDPQMRTPTAAMLYEELNAFDTEPASAMRRQLGELVETAAAASAGAEGRYLENTPLNMDAETPHLHVPTTADMPTIDYRIESHDGRLFGPWSYAQTVEAIATARIGARDRVSVGGTPQAPLEDVPSLARHLPMRSLGVNTRERDPILAADENEPIADGGLVRTMALAVMREDTGLLLCEQGGVRKEVYLKTGRAEFVTSNLAGELLGEYLVARGVISRGELDMALAVMPRFEGRLGDTLAGLGLVEPVHLFQHIAAQVREKLLDLFAWTSGRAQLWRGVQAPASSFRLGLEGWAIVDEGIRRRIASGLESAVTHAPKNARLIRAGTPKTFEINRLPREAQQVLTLLTRPMSIDEVRAAIPKQRGDSQGALPSIVLLLHLRAIDWTVATV
ncbi:MAG: protein kinase [Sandaracinaceae bacterium]|nr:protein kinase [Sandaracinaceae bacterium]